MLPTSWCLSYLQQGKKRLQEKDCRWVITFIYTCYIIGYCKIVFFLVFRKIFKILKIFKKPIDSKESYDDCLNQKMKKLSVEIRDYPDDFQDYKAYNLNNCPCRICELKSSLSLLFM